MLHARLVVFMTEIRTFKQSFGEVFVFQIWLKIGRNYYLPFIDEMIH